MGYFVKNISAGRKPYGVQISSGTTLDRPENPTSGLMRFNETNNIMEYFNGTDFVSIISPGAVSIVVDKFIGDNVQTLFTMSDTVLNEQQIIVFVGGVHQDPTSAYTTITTDITFSTAPPLNSVVSIIHNVGKIA